MLREFRHWIARKIAPAYFEWCELEMDVADKKATDAEQRAKDAENAANVRYARLVSEMDPFEPLFRKLSIVYSKEFTRPEEKLNSQGQLGMMMWAYQQKDDVHFNHLVDWIMNSHGNQAMNAKTDSKEALADRILYGRAQISSMILLRKEIGRLASGYEEVLSKLKGEDFDPSTSAED